jgi:hypothetical protein
MMRAWMDAVTEGGRTKESTVSPPQYTCTANSPKPRLNEPQQHLGCATTSRIRGLLCECLRARLTHTFCCRCAGPCSSPCVLCCARLCALLPAVLIDTLKNQKLHKCAKISRGYSDPSPPRPLNMLAVSVARLLSSMDLSEKDFSLTAQGKEASNIQNVKACEVDEIIRADWKRVSRE